MVDDSILEIACFSTSAAIEAANSGADRVEFCTDYRAGGCSPHPDEVISVSNELTIPIVVMVRLRPGNFLYSRQEVEAMRNYISALNNSAIEGFVLGAITSDKTPDYDALAKFKDAAGNKELIFHRAFDSLKDSAGELKELHNAGISRILSSGGPGNASDHKETLQSIFNAAPKGLTIMPGGGIRPATIDELRPSIPAKEWHSSAITNNNHLPDRDLIRLMKNILHS
jgi:copper homeostasis protein